MKISLQKAKEILDSLPDNKISHANLIFNSQMSDEAKERWMKGWIQELMDSGLVTRSMLFDSKEQEQKEDRELFEEVVKSFPKEKQEELESYKEEFWKAYQWAKKTLDDDINALQFISHKMILYAIKKDGFEDSKETIKKIGMFQGYDYDKWKD